MKFPGVLIAYSRIFRAVVIDKSQLESEERLVKCCQEPAQLDVRAHWLAAVAVSVIQFSDTVSEEKIAASFSLNTFRQYLISKNFWIVTGAA